MPDDSCNCALLLFGLPSQAGDVRDFAEVMNTMSGSHGYTHVAVQCCQADADNAPIAIQADVKAGEAHTTELETWSERAYARVPLGMLPGVGCGDLCLGANRMVERHRPYSLARVIHLLGDEIPSFVAAMPPEGLLCSDVLTFNLPEALVEHLYACLESWRRDFPGIAGIGQDGNKFFTPNGLALALGLPPASELTELGGQEVPARLCD